eukprot:m.89619 g.89619  ORF g.89619 m.89619 type:complete len:761 (+) comp8836_c0_seq2:1481-3763(+)
MPVLINVHPLRHIRDTFDLPPPRGGDIPMLVCQLVGRNVCAHVSSLTGPADFHVAKRTDPSSFHAQFASHRRHVLVCIRTHTSPSLSYDDAVRWFGRRTPSLDAFKGHSSVCSLLYTPSVTRSILRVSSSIGLTIYHSLVQLLASLCVYCDGYKLASFPTSSTKPHKIVKIASSKSLSSTSYYLFRITLNGDFQVASKALLAQCSHLIGSCLSSTDCSMSLCDVFIAIDALEGNSCTFPQNVVDLVISASLKVPVQHSPAKNIPSSSSVEPAKTASSSSSLLPTMIGAEELPEISVLTFQSCNNYQHTKLLRSAVLFCGDCVLVGCKFVPQLTAFQAKQLTIHEVGQPKWRTSVSEYTRHPLFIAVIGGVGVVAKLRRFVQDAKLLREEGLLDICQPCLECTATTHNITCSSSRGSALVQCQMLLSERELLVPASLFYPFNAVPSSWAAPDLYFPTSSCVVVRKDGVPHLPHILHDLYLGGFHVEQASLMEISPEIQAKLSTATPTFASSSEMAVIHVKRCNAVAALAASVRIMFEDTSKSPPSYIFVPSSLEEASVLVSTLFSNCTMPSSPAIVTQKPSKSSLMEIMTVVVPYTSPTSTSQEHLDSSVLHPNRVLTTLVRKGYQLVGLFIGKGDVSALPSGVHRLFHDVRVNGGGKQTLNRRQSLLTFRGNSEMDSMQSQQQHLACFALQRLNGITCHNTLVPDLTIWGALEKKDRPQQQPQQQQDEGGCWFSATQSDSLSVISSCLKYLSSDAVVALS